PIIVAHRPCRQGRRAMVHATRRAATARGPDEWPVVPPVPTPTPPPPMQVGPEPPVISRPTASETPFIAPMPTRVFSVPLVPRPGVTVALRTRPPRRAVVVPSRADN